MWSRHAKLQKSFHPVRPSHKCLSPRKEDTWLKSCKLDWFKNFRFPTCVVAMKNLFLSKLLSDDEIRHLTSNNFKEWKNYVITRHFRHELDIGPDQSLPRIAEVTKVEED